MSDRSQRIHWIVSHLADLVLVLALIVGAILYFGGAL